jgi:hypothetical protein
MIDRKHAGGRPLLYNSPEDLEKAILEYYKECKDNKKTIITKEGKEIKISFPLIPTIAGLAYHLGIDRHTIYNYEKRDEYFHTIKKARDYILSQMESSLMNSDGNVTGKIFLAKNYGYTDKKEIEHSGDLNIYQQLSNLSEDEFNKMKKKIKNANKE